MYFLSNVIKKLYESISLVDEMYKIDFKLEDLKIQLGELSCSVYTTEKPMSPIKWLRISQVLIMLNYYEFPKDFRRVTFNIMNRTTNS